MAIYSTNEAMNYYKLFLNITNPTQKKYEILRSFHYEKLSAKQIAKRYKISHHTVYSIVKDFKEDSDIDALFTASQLGRKPKEDSVSAKSLIIEYRKKNLSVPDIKAILDSRDIEVSERQIYNILIEDGFLRLPRRTKEERDISLANVPIEAEKSIALKYADEEFSANQAAGILCFLPYIYKYGIDGAIDQSSYPGTVMIGKTSSILSFLALKLANFARYTADDQWCMDRGLGLFAGLNVLPKASWFSSYSHRITREMNLQFLKNINGILSKHQLLSDSVNLDFSAIPYWGEDNDHLDNNWSGSRHKALPSILAAIAQDPDSGMITYGDTTADRDKSQVILEFLDFYRTGSGADLKYLVFDSKFTTYENLKKLDDNGVKFLTIRRRGANIVDQINALPKEAFKKIRVACAHGKTRSLTVNDSRVHLKDYGGELRQIAIIGRGRIKPALIITNDFELSTEKIVLKYAKRWLVEQEISEQIYFFHLNKVSSSMVIKVDFDLTMSILAHNLYRLLAEDLDGYSTASAKTLFDKFISNSAFVKIGKKEITVALKKKRHLPGMLTAMQRFSTTTLAHFQGRKLLVTGSSTS